MVTLDSKANFVVIEGIDGSGKSTLIKDFKKNLSETGVGRTSDYNFFYEPTRESRWGVEIREILKGEKEISARLNVHLLDLFKKDRYWNLETNVRPALEKGSHVIQDRYYFSTAVYQGRDKEQVFSILKEYQNDPQIIKPDIVFYLDIKPEQALKRIQSRFKESKAAQEVFEHQTELEKIRSNYREIFSAPAFLLESVMIDASKSPEHVLRSVQERLF